jgi:hypothetical protein
VPAVKETTNWRTALRNRLTRTGGFRCKLQAVLWSPVGAPAGVPGPRRNADECDAGWFAPVATRRRSMFAARRPAHLGLAVQFRGDPGTPHWLRPRDHGARRGNVAARQGDPKEPGPARAGFLRAAGALEAAAAGTCRRSPVTPHRRRRSGPVVRGGRGKRHAGVFPGRLASRCSVGQNCFYQQTVLTLLNPFPGYYSGLLNVTMATPIMVRPITSTMVRDSHIGTTQPPQVIPGDSACMATGSRFRWLNTACRIGPTT